MSRFIFILSLIILVFLAGLSLAGIPKMINYQGMLTDNSGTPLTDTVSITFKIYDNSSGGNKKWEETQSSVPVINGLFNVILGSVTPIDTLSFNQDYWLDITVGAEHMPTRLKFTSVGYAYRALKSQRSDTAYYAETIDLTPLDSRYVNEGQANSVDSGMIKDYSIVRVDVATYFKAPYSDTADYARAGGTGPDNDWKFRVTDTADTTITTGGCWGVARFGNQLFGNADSTHVNLGVACTTGTNGQNRKYCTVGGGWRNTASGSDATVGGGERNTASGSVSIVGGGYANCTSGGDATIAGGAYDTASGNWATVGGGSNNTASGSGATAGGGLYNSASAYYAIVGGGYDNTASRGFATVGGGGFNAASESSATVGGGELNTASAYWATVGGGEYNRASGIYATVGGGNDNTASGDSATIGGGTLNTASGPQATVGGGTHNAASYYYATVGGGFGDTASNSGATVGGGHRNTVSGWYATVGGGYRNIVKGDYSAIPGGAWGNLTTAADYSMAFGYGVYVNNSYRVVFFDATNSGRLGINRDDYDGGISYPIHVGTITSNGNGAYLTNGGVWTNGSSRTFKENFQPLNSQELLEKISSIPVEAWNFKNSDERHIGPVAEDFVSAFDVGTVREDGARDNKYLSTEDIAGVALAGVKELINENQELKQTIEKLSQRIAELEKSR